MAERFVVIADENKLVDYLGQTFVLPVEVSSSERIEDIQGVKVNRRVNEDVPFTTDNGNYILDCTLPEGIDPYDMHEF